MASTSSFLSSVRTIVERLFIQGTCQIESMGKGKKTSMISDSDHTSLFSSSLLYELGYTMCSYCVLLLLVIAYIKISCDTHSFPP